MFKSQKINTKSLNFTDQNTHSNQNVKIKNQQKSNK